MKTADKFLEEAAATFKARNAIYGNNFLSLGTVMSGLFPNGVTVVTPDEWNRLHLIVLQVVKMSRYCNSFKTGGHGDSAHDNTVYAAMLEQVDGGIKEKECKSPKSQKSATASIERIAQLSAITRNRLGSMRRTGKKKAPSTASSSQSTTRTRNPLPVTKVGWQKRKRPVGSTARSKTRS